MIGWALEAMLASALLMLAVLVLRGPVRTAFGARIAYALWALPALRLVMPPLPEGWRGEALPVLPAPEPIVIMLGEPVATLPVETTHSALGWPPVALGLWLGGAALLLAWQAVGYLRFRYNVLRLGIAVDRVGSITVVQSAATDGPLAFGVFDRVVAFPRDFAARFDPEERALALEHELVTMRAAIWSPIGSRWRCSRCTGSTRWHGPPSANSAPIRKWRTTRACWRAPTGPRATLTAARSSRPRMVARCRPPATSTPSRI